MGAILGTPPESLGVSWRFERSRPAQMTIRGSNDTRLTLSLDEPEIESPLARAFDFGPPRARAWSLREMSDRLGLTR